MQQTGRNLQMWLGRKPVSRPWLPGFGVFEREVRRFFAVPAQTIFAPLGSSLIYFSLFGLAIGRLISTPGSGSVTHGLSYIQFLIPGIVAMEVINASVQNPMSSIMISKWSGTIIDVLVAPLSPLSIWLAFLGGAFVRTCLVTIAVMLAGILCAWHIPPINPALLLLSMLLTTGIFGSLGIAAGAICKSWDQVGILMSFIIQPLVFFSGVFFSFQSFPGWLQDFRFVNPIFYIVSAFRYSVLGVSDVTPWISFVVSGIFLYFSSFVAIRVLKSGFGLRS